MLDGTRRTCIAATLLGLSACTQDLYSLDTVPILGATADEEAVLRTEIAQLQEEMDLTWVTLSKIKVLDAPERSYSWKGRYLPFHGGSLTLRRFAGSGRVRQTLRHEICHAADHDLGWASQDGPAMTDAYYHWAEHTGDHGHYGVRFSRKVEGFARLCEQGASALLALREDQDEERPWIVDAIDEVDALLALTPPDAELPVEPWLTWHEPPEEVHVFADGRVAMRHGSRDWTLLSTEGEVLARYDRWPRLDDTLEPIQGDPTDLFRWQGGPDGDVSAATRAGGVTMGWVTLPGSSTQRLFFREGVERPWATTDVVSDDVERTWMWRPEYTKVVVLGYVRGGRFHMALVDMSGA